MSAVFTTLPLPFTALALPSKASRFVVCAAMSAPTHWEAHIPNALLTPLWGIWAVVSAAGFFLALIVVASILRDPKLRRSSFNKYIVALSVPDALFGGFCAVDCFRNTVSGQWAPSRGDGNCQWQGIYVMWGFTCSIWVILFPL